MFTHVVTDETSWENHLPDCAVSLVRQVLLNWTWLHKLTSCKPRISLPAQILIVSTWQWQKDVIYSPLQGFRIISREKSSSPASLVTASHVNMVFIGHFSEATCRIRSSPDLHISEISAIHIFYKIYFFTFEPGPSWPAEGYITWLKFEQNKAACTKHRRTGTNHGPEVLFAWQEDKDQNGCQAHTPQPR